MVYLPYIEEEPDASLVTGKNNFDQSRLNMLQIGLGTFGTFVQNLTCPSEVYPNVSWLLDASSNNSRSLLAVGVEPVPEHVGRLRPLLLQHLPCACLVQAAVGRQDQNVEVYAITQDLYKKYAQTVRPGELQTFDDLVLFLRNMSCVGQAHPAFQRLSTELEAQCGVKVETQPIKARAVTYGFLARMLRFSGVEVLLIDAEGYDCKILQSMIDHCTELGNGQAWPDVIQFETMGHSNWMVDSSSKDMEAETCRSLESHGYVVACYGTDTQLVRHSALISEARLQRWVNTFRCDRCRIQGQEGMPFLFRSGAGTMCHSCTSLFHIFGSSVWEWASQPGDPKLCSVTTNGVWVWGVDFDGRACCCRDGHWEYSGSHLKHVSVSRDESQVWALDECGRVLQCSSWPKGRWKELPNSPRLLNLSVSGDGWVIWGTDHSGQIWTLRWDRRQWQLLSGWLDQVSVSWDGSHIWGVNQQGKIYYRSSSGSWTAVPGWLRQVAVSADGCHVWGINDCWQIFYRPSSSGCWARVTGSLTQVCASEDGRRVWGTDTSGHVWGFGIK
mmetsp:Transcript_79173/g.183710  ORF Transcript_79173/g.183710 Transcript_79173/m.183710 type:complete len:556 (+) Transcript_79173:72-1739(+)